jgi:hypothetical protein
MTARSSKRWQAMLAMGLAGFLWGTPPQKPTPKDSRRPVPQGAVSRDAVETTADSRTAGSHDEAVRLGPAARVQSPPAALATGQRMGGRL